MGLKSFKEFVYNIKEMALNVSNRVWNPLNQKSDRYKNFEETKNNSKYSYQIDHPDIKIHSIKFKDSRGPLGQTITTNDHKNAESLHHAKFMRYTKFENMELPHDVQRSVSRIKSDKLPPKHAENVTMHYIERNKVPLISSSEQYRAGHLLWRNLSHRALEAGHHVYHYDGEKIQKTTPENIEQHLDNSFGDTAEHKHRHMIISKNPLSKKVYNDIS